MEKVVLQAEKRDVTGKQVKAMRRAGKLPAVIYGRHIDPIAISLDSHSASLTLGRLTSSSLVTIRLDGVEYPALVREKQRDYIKNRLLHVDFLAVSADETITASVVVNFVGVSTAVKDYNAVFVVNLPRYAGGLSFAPQASGTDGLLDVCTFKEGSLWSGLVYLSGVMLGQHESMQDFARVQTRRLRIESTGPAPYQLDGDPGGELPVEIRALPGRLTLLVSPSWAERHGFEANP